MKNSPTDAEDRPQPSEAWREALTLFDADLRRRGMAEKTRRAYGVDLGQFALWCTAQGVGAARGRLQELRRWAAVLSGRDAVAATIARKLRRAARLLPHAARARARVPRTRST
jgi:integrase/recombinase XerC/integrase/recombinase XerD